MQRIKQIRGKAIALLCMVHALLLLAAPALSASAAEAHESFSAFGVSSLSEADVKAEAVRHEKGSGSSIGNRSLPDRLIPGGMAFGVKMYTKGIWIVGLSDVIGSDGKACCPARDCGMEVGDMILAVNRESVQTVKDLTDRIENSEGQPLTITISRGKNTMTVTLRAVRSNTDGVWRAGFWIRDNTAGIGTVTYIDPLTGAFGGLGHGICDVASGQLIPSTGGAIMDVTVSGVVPSKIGEPGELKGYFRSHKTGSLISNKNEGVFGLFASLPDAASQALPVAKLEDLKTGTAHILCTLNDQGIREYEIRIDAIHSHPAERKNFEITVTDPELLAITGGIVQGMSGSPIIQNGKIIGAVTHVLINDPTKGYGIFIENMLQAAG